jgi:hypothetical protein
MMDKYQRLDCKVRMSLINRSKPVMVSALAVFLVFANVQISQAATSTNVDKFFAAVKSAKPVDIEAARKKYIAPNSSADFYAQMIVKHFTGTEYLKTLDRVGNVSPSSHDLPGKLTKSKDGSFKLDSTFNTIDGTYKDFVLNKSKKISSFKVKTTNNSFVSIKENIQLLTINYNNGGTEFKTGIHWKLPTGYSFVQLDFVNNFGGFKSWSYARGYIRDASGVNHNTVTGPLGCTNTGGKTVIEATTSTVTAIVKNTTSTVIIPMYASCTGDNYGEISVPFLVQ